MGPENALWKRIWGTKMSERLKMLVWRIAADVLPTRCRLARVLAVADHTCLLCNGGPESIFHIFVECDVVNRV